MAKKVAKLLFVASVLLLLFSFWFTFFFYLFTLASPRTHSLYLSFSLWQTLPIVHGHEAYARTYTQTRTHRDCEANAH